MAESDMAHAHTTHVISSQLRTIRDTTGQCYLIVDLLANSLRGMWNLHTLDTHYTHSNTHLVGLRQLHLYAANEGLQG